MKQQNKYRFIPYRRSDIVEMCLQDGQLPRLDEDFRQLSYMLEQVFHFEFHQVVEALKDAYAGLDPDSDTRDAGIAPKAAPLAFVQLLDGLLEKANYERVSQSELNQALIESSLFKIRLHVDFDDFSEGFWRLEGGDEIVEHIADRDRLCLGHYPAWGDHDWQTLDQVPQNLE